MTKRRDRKRGERKREVGEGQNRKRGAKAEKKEEEKRREGRKNKKKRTRKGFHGAASEKLYNYLII